MNTASARLSPRQILDALVSFPTVSRDTNLPLIVWVEEYLASHGITAHRHYHEDGQKAALFAHVGPWEEGAVVLSGHTDVVPVDGQQWDTDPFTVVEKDGKLYGRGTTDMKGFDALSIWALVEAAHADLKRPLQIALSYDEEVGCIGAEPLIKAMAPVLPKAEAVIVGEPSMMEAVTAHKGGTGYKVHVHGFEVHSSLLPYGVSAILEAGRLLNWVNTTNEEIQAQEPGPAAQLFKPPFTTFHVGLIEGGTARNITAKDCEFAMEMRVLPTESIDDWKARFEAEVAEIEKTMQEKQPTTSIQLDPFFRVPGLRPEEDGPAEQLVRSITGDNATHAVSYGTEAGHFQNHGYSAVVCGPGDIAQAHQPNEFITIEQFDAGKAFMEKLLSRLKGH
ncbi:acetylornithine deacetylase [Chachezhania sediminis]|uniref:acetylornithine deacetylase n=1 Tax=Chachezhania sediminis TaxID=2599291 RepID=UPI00131DD0B5|nr:acetylornithine deacetylase [Chachezhania sediminis]